LKTGQKLFIQNPDDLIGVFGGLFGPIDARGISWGVDQEKVIVVFRGCGCGFSSGTKAKINGGFFRRSFLPKHLLELQRVVVGEKDVVVG
jgi:hypothetical protein